MGIHNIIWFFALVVILRFITNLYKYFRIREFHDKYINHIRKSNHKFIQNKEEIKSLFKDAGLKDSSVIHQEFLGFGHYENMRISVFENLTNRREDIVGNVQNRFNEAIGVYRKRFRESFNPMFWIDLIIKLPQYIMEFFGVLPEKISVKIVLVVYWILAILFGANSFNLIHFLIK